MRACKLWRGWVAMATAAAWLGGLVSAHGQAAPALVSGNGVAVVKAAPETLRMSVLMSITGKDIKDAMANLKARQDAVRPQLVAAGAVEKSVRCTPTEVAGGANDPQQRMAMMMQARMRAMGKAKPEAAGAKAVTVKSTLTAEFSLKAEKPEQSTIMAYELQEKVKAMNLGGPPAKTAESAEAQEEAEEMMGMDDGQPKPGEPTFIYVARIGADQRAKATADAFNKAKAEANRLGAAAGVSVGAIQHLSATSMPQMTHGMNYSYQMAMAQMMMNADGTPTQSDSPDEVIGANAHEVALQVAVSASFLITAAR